MLNYNSKLASCSDYDEKQKHKTPFLPNIVVLSQNNPSPKFKIKI